MRLAILALLCCGCDSEPYYPHATASFLTADGATNLAARPKSRPLGLRLETDGLIFDAAQWRGRLRSWPALVDVGVALESQPGESLTAELLTFATDGLIVDDWYAFSIDALPPPYVWDGIALADGTHAMRFKLGSDPRFTDLTICDSKAQPGNELLVDIGFSEAMLPWSMGDILLESETGPIDCSPVDNGGGELHCAGVAIPTKLTFVRPLQSAAGTTLPAETFVIDSLLTQPYNCRMWIRPW